MVASLSYVPWFLSLSLFLLTTAQQRPPVRHVEGSYTNRPHYPSTVHVQPHSQPQPPSHPHPPHILPNTSNPISYRSRDYERSPNSEGYPMYPMSPPPPGRPTSSNDYSAQPSYEPRPRPQNPPLPPLVPEPPAGTLVAYIHGNGLLGYFMFSHTRSGQTAISYHIVGGSGDDLQWKIYSHPTQLSGFSCSASVIGTMMHDLTLTYGSLRVGRLVVYDSDLSLSGEDSIYGRSIVIESHQSRLRTCATIMPATKKTTYVAKFHYPVAGSVHVFESPSQTGVLVEYMMYSDGKRTERTHSWSLLGASGQDASMDAQVENEINRCANLKGVPIMPTSSKYPKVLTVSTERPTMKGRTYQIVKGMQPLRSVDAVYMVVYEHKNPQKVLACAPLRELMPKKAVAKFSSHEIQGTIELQQDSPYDPTRVETDLSITGTAYSFGIDTLPTIKRRKNEVRKCPNVKETIFNPLQKDPEEVPPQAFGTTDQYAVGDLSGKYGTLDNPKNHKMETLDFNLPMFGHNSVIGRAIVMYTPEGPAMGCANIELQHANITTSYATFDVPLQGQFIFRQDAANCFDDVYIYIEVSKPDGPESKKTFNHPWHVHESPVNAGYDSLSTTECKAAGPHMNVFNVSTACIYQRDCNVHFPQRCELGDETGKLAPLDIPPYKVVGDGEPDVGKYYFVDADLSNCGPNSIVGRSIVIHQQDFGAPRITCSNILEFKSKASA